MSLGSWKATAKVTQPVSILGINKNVVRLDITVGPTMPMYRSQSSSDGFHNCQGFIFTETLKVRKRALVQWHQDTYQLALEHVACSWNDTSKLIVFEFFHTCTLKPTYNPTYKPTYKPTHKPTYKWPTSGSSSAGQCAGEGACVCDEGWNGAQVKMASCASDLNP
jgi:hypothetical protein